ncbi:MAG: CotH kinase family protein [Oscillibacter sp.]|nr:CotH kinase family protein [Oscillibacter sp.]
MSFGGGGPGRGRDFRMSEFWNEANADNGADSASDGAANTENVPDGAANAENVSNSAANTENVSNSAANTENAFRQRGGMRGMGGMGGGRPFPGMPFPGGTGGQSNASGDAAPDFDAFDPTGGFGDMPFPGFGNFPGMGDASGDGTDGGFPGGFGGMRGMGSDDVKLKYTDDNPESYGSIFDNAKTDVTAADKARLIASLKSLGEMENLKSVVNMDEVLRYFVVHNYVVNGDSYTGSMIHNYYLYEKDGQLSMIPWDYNLAFGGFQGGSASGSVNDPIDTPLSVSGDGDRPMADWLAQEEYVDLYHAYFNDFLNSVDATAIIDAAYPLIASYVERDPTKFCSYEDFEKGVTALRTFCELRTESVRGQLNGSIPSTDDGQSADNSALIDASGLTLSDMGNMGFGGGRGGRFGRANGQTSSDAQESGASGDGEQDALPGIMGFPDGNFPDNPDDGFPVDTSGDSPDNMSGGFPDDSQTASDDGQPLSDNGFPDGNSPGGFPGGNFPGGGFPGGGPGGGFTGDMGGDFPGFQSDGGTSLAALSKETWIALGASVVVLCAGLLTARLYQRRKRFA